MRVLVIYSKEGRLDEIAKRLSNQLQKLNCQVQMMQAEVSATTPIPCSPYDVVCVGSPTVGFFGGRIAGDIAPTIKRCTRLEGRNTVAFVTPRMFGTGKSLKSLMKHLEKEGAMVQDFAALSNEREIERFASRITNIH